MQVPLDQAQTLGVSVKTLVFDQQGYVTSAFLTVLGLLNVNVQTLLVDLYYNSFIDRWQLCPAPFPANATVGSDTGINTLWNGESYNCSTTASPALLMQQISLYIILSNFNTEVNLVQLLFNLRPIVARKNELISTAEIKGNAGVGNSSLADTLGNLGQFLFTPRDLTTFQSTRSHASLYYNESIFPSGQTLLLTDNKRVVAMVVSNDVPLLAYNLSSLDNNTVFSNNFKVSYESTSSTETADLCASSINSTNADVYAGLSLSSFRFIVDNEKEPFTNESFLNYVRCGYSPILNSTYNKLPSDNSLDLGGIINTFVPLSFWSWAPGQPGSLEGVFNATKTSTGDSHDDSLKDSNRKRGRKDPFDKTDMVREIIKRGSPPGQDDQTSIQQAFKCAALDGEGWNVANCYALYHFACKSMSSPVEWVVRNDSYKLYFDASGDTDGCPNGYIFGIPTLSIEMLALVNTVQALNISYPVWIDMNDITVPNCFVSGGPYAPCPYQKTVTRLALVRLIAPSFLVAVAVLVLLFLERFMRTTPIHTNRKRQWKKVLQEYYKNDYEGVPA